jgi:putative intracellular protease/amidase
MQILHYIFDDMADFETIFLCHLLAADCGIKVVNFAKEEKPIRSISGMIYHPEYGIDQINVNDFDGIIIPGGWQAEHPAKLKEFLQEINNQNKLIGAICAAPWILATSGILLNKKYTTSIGSWGEKHKEFFKIENPFNWENFKDARVVCDGNIITAKGIAFIDFAIKVLELLGQFSNEDEIEEFRKNILGV